MKKTGEEKPKKKRVYNRKKPEGSPAVNQQPALIGAALLPQKELFLSGSESDSEPEDVSPVKTAKKISPANPEVCYNFQICSSL